MVKTLSAEEYTSVVENANKPIVLEFGADW